ncbi:hypothetical protein UlMin_013710 [Ulmus minor]
MCHKNNTSRPSNGRATRSKLKKKQPLKPARKSRTKTRKPKFLSLRLHLSREKDQTFSPSDMRPRPQLNLFPLHPENLVEDRAHDHEEDVSFLFDSDGGATLNGLLPTAAATKTMSEEEEDSMSLAYRGHDRYSEENEYNNSSSLVRTAMKRNRDWDTSEEKWVCYSEVVEKKEVEVEVEEVTSSSSATETWWKKQQRKGLLALKLDYEGILNAWSDKGSLFIKGESPQTVPDLQDDFFACDNTIDVLKDSLGSAGNVWKVPEMASNCSSSLKTKEEVGAKDGWKLGQREASVLRYKEKRQSRLFSKRIRYEVRKLNAEKRPRMKGRFVKIG